MPQATGELRARCLNDAPMPPLAEPPGLRAHGTRGASVIPGPSVMFVVGRSSSLGRRGGLLSVVGNALGLSAGHSRRARYRRRGGRSHGSLFGYQVCGGRLLVYLGVQAIRHRLALVSEEVGVSARSSWRLLAEGFTVGLTSPKTIVFFVAVIPEFVDYSAGYVPVQMLVLGITVMTIGLICDSVWVPSASLPSRLVCAVPEADDADARHRRRHDDRPRRHPRVHRWQVVAIQKSE